MPWTGGLPSPRRLQNCETMRSMGTSTSLEGELLLTRCFVRAELPAGTSTADVERRLDEAIRLVLNDLGTTPEVVRVAHVASPEWRRHA